MAVALRREFRDLLEASPLSATVVMDVLRNAARQHARSHAFPLRLTAAHATSVVVETVAAHTHTTDNILWPPSTLLRGAFLAALLLPWPPAATILAQALRHRRQQPNPSP